MRFLHIDDDKEDRLLTKQLIARTKHWSYAGVETIDEGVAAWEMETPQVVLIDIGFTGRPESETYDAIRTMSRTCPVMALSGRSDMKSVNDARDAGAICFLNKDVLDSPQKFHDAIVRAVEMNLARHVGDSDQSSLIKQLAEAVFYGNGKPSILARLEAGDQRMQSIEGKVDSLKDSTDSGRIEQRIRGVIIVASVLLTLFRVFTASSPADMQKAIQEMVQKAGEK